MFDQPSTVSIAGEGETRPLARSRRRLLRGITGAAELAVVSGGPLTACSGSLGTKKEDDGASFPGARAMSSAAR